MQAYMEWLGKNKENLASLGLSESVISRKMRLLSLAALCSKNSVIEFAAVAEALKINGDDIEAWVIDVIRAGLAEVKIDELNEKLIVSRSTHTEFGAQQWQELQKRLNGWHQNLGEVQQVLDNVRTQLRGKPSN